MNLVDLATELEYVPKEQLAQMSQDPSSRYPQYLVLSEIQRRTANEKAYAAAKPRPTTTVAEEVVGEFMQPQSLQAGMPSESAPTDAFSSESMGIPASAPMQQPMMMAGGGLTAYANGGALEQSFADPYENVLGSSTNPYPVDDEVSFLEDRYIDEEGNIRYGTALGDATFVIPGLGALGAVGRLGLGALRRYTPNILQKTKGLFTSANPALASLKTGQRKVKTDKGYDTIDTATGKKIPEQLFDAKKSLAAVSYPAAAATLISRSADDEETTKPTNTETDTEKQLAELRNKATGIAKPKKEIDYDLVGLGGLIMGARNMSELGTGLAGLAERRQAREDALLEGQAQQDYYRASADKVRAEIEGLPLENKMDALEKVNDILTKALEGEIELTEEQLQYYNVASQTLTSQILALQGITANSLTGLDPLEENRIQ